MIELPAPVWRTHSGQFSQVGYFNGQKAVKWAEGGRINEQLQALSSVFDFSSLRGMAVGLASGVERFSNVGNMIYEVEFYVIDEPAKIGEVASALMRGGKVAKRARQGASVSVRAKWWSTSGAYEGKAYAGWVKLWDPRVHAEVKVDINEIEAWTRSLEHEVGMLCRKMEALSSRTISPRSLIGPVMFAASKLRSGKPLSFSTVVEVHLRETYYATARAILRDLAESGKALSDFDYKKLRALYE